MGGYFPTLPDPPKAHGRPNKSQKNYREPPPLDNSYLMAHCQILPSLIPCLPWAISSSTPCDVMRLATEDCCFRTCSVGVASDLVRTLSPKRAPGATYSIWRNSHCQCSTHPPSVLVPSPPAHTRGAPGPRSKPGRSPAQARCLEIWKSGIWKFENLGCNTIPKI